MANTQKVSVPEGSSKQLKWSHAVTSADANGLIVAASVAGQANASKLLPVEVQVAIPELELTFTGPSGVVTSTAYQDFTLVVKNASDTPAENTVLVVTVPDTMNTIPNNASYVTTTQGDWTVNSRTATFNIGTVTMGNDVTATLRVTMLGTARDGSISPSATVSATKGQSVTKTASFNWIQPPNVSSSIDYGGGYTLLQNSQRTFKASYTANASYGLARNAMLTITYPTDCTAPSSSAVTCSRGTVSVSSRTVTFNLGTLNPGDTFDISIPVTISTTAASTTITGKFEADNGYSTTSNYAMACIATSNVLQSSYSWSQIASRSASASDVGKVREIDITGYGKYLFRVIGVNVDKYGSSTSRYTFECVDIVAYEKFNETHDTTGGWADSQLKTWMNGTLYNAFPSDVRSVMRNVSKATRPDSSSNTAAVDVTSYLWIMSYCEVNASAASRYQGEGTLYAYYSTHSASSDRIKRYKSTFSYSSGLWWLRTYSSTTTMWAVGTTGGIGGYFAGIEYGVSPCFCV